MHIVKVNALDKPFEHPVTGQIIMPGQSYAEPDEKTVKEQETMRKTAEKLAKAAAKKQKDGSDTSDNTGDEGAVNTENTGGDKIDGEAAGGDK